MSMARSTTLPAAIDYLIESSIQFHLLIMAIKPARKGSNQSDMIRHILNNFRDLILALVLSSVI